VIPDHVDEKHPANNPYATLNTNKVGIVEENPQRNNTASVLPTVEIVMQVITWYRSARCPMVTLPNTDARFRSITVSEDIKLEPPILRAYVGRYMPGRKNPSASMMLPI
jgi:hypothetical protein